MQWGLQRRDYGAAGVGGGFGGSSGGALQRSSRSFDYHDGCASDHGSTHDDGGHRSTCNCNHGCAGPHGSTNDDGGRAAPIGTEVIGSTIRSSDSRCNLWGLLRCNLWGGRRWRWLWWQLVRCIAGVVAAPSITTTAAPVTMAAPTMTDAIAAPAISTMAAPVTMAAPMMTDVMAAPMTTDVIGSTMAAPLAKAGIKQGSIFDTYGSGSTGAKVIDVACACMMTDVSSGELHWDLSAVCTGTYKRAAGSSWRIACWRRSCAGLLQ